ncbi:metal ABC transporter solute-binding protein, Zn/Mn family [Verrucosispora sioxanthis]|uniref:Zinc ABC transporter substrate-binding protein n=1 Tax=Verrucosispora sioxanthis TaxID=2499994 RepID=A0A6M1L625_9ACTN|nr:zinc ABC transporter substrate-binding protein [Verrucosispora sioxanthis]NEE64454.1 zinc ABC transporter substrate-binding protein [Verrucosispora sioxanthis]NGM13564.1 zinc ABC transporter substrate-binding protein [Verrucosispora sioxanthis]
MRLIRATALTAVATLSLLVSGCSNTDDPAPSGSVAPTAQGPKVVASTSWVGAFAKAAGATDVTVVAPATVQHPPDYDPKPSDLAAVTDADYILFAEFDGFAPRLKEAAGGTGQLIPVQLENTPDAIRSEVTRLAGVFGTTATAEGWLSTFDTEYAKLSQQIRSALPNPPPVAASHLFMAYWGEFAGLTVAGTYGPQPVTPSQLADLTAKKPKLVLANAHLPGANPDIPSAKRVDIVNFPGADLDLLEVFRTNTERLVAAVAS